jgi:two-component system, NtrC family, nitrogen regulation sensor histidine kinase GlnL
MATITINWLLLMGTAAANLWVGIYVFTRAPKAPLNRAFGFLAFATSCWAMALAVGYHVSPPPADLHSTTAIIRFAFAAGSLFAASFLLFIDRFALISRSACILVRCFLVPIGIAFFAISFSPLIVTSARSLDEGLQVTYGPLHPLFAVYALVGLTVTVYLLVRKYRRSEGLEAVQVRYVILAFVLSGALITTTNVVLPLLLGTSTYGRYGPLFSLLLLGIIGHAIIRHRLMDIRLVIHRGATYLAALVITAGVLALVLTGSNVLLPDEHDFSLREILLAAVVVVLLSPVRTTVQHLFDRYLYRNPYDYAHTLREASHALTATIDLQSLLGHTGAVIEDTFHPDGIGIYLFDPEDRQFNVSWSLSSALLPGTIDDDSALVRALGVRPLLFSDEIPSVDPSDTTDSLYELLHHLRIEVVVSLREEGDLVGFVAIGAKRSGDPYFSNDVDLLTTLANQAAVAVRNAQTHARVVHMNEQLNKVLETIESGVVAVGPRGRITLFNRAAEQLTGTSTKLAHGQSPESLPAPLAELLQATAADGQPRAHVEFSLPGLAGHVVPLICSTLPLRGPGGATVGAVAVLNDISRLKELEQEKRRVERLTSIEAIASGLIHEIRNPLVGIKTYAQLLPSRGASEEFRDMFSRTAGREIGRIDDLLSRFRTISLAAQQPVQAVDISGPLRDTFETLHAEMQDRQIRLRQVGDVAHRPVLGNASQLQQLFLNLCLNAIQAMEAGGELTVRVADLSEGGGNTLIVEVADTGPGIPEELLATIFDAFVTTKPHGTGLGLAICRGIADAHHARLAARNNVGRPGCTFTVEFPVPSGRPTRIAP